jgi:hypothetical protein
MFQYGSELPYYWKYNMVPAGLKSAPQNCAVHRYRAEDWTWEQSKSFKYDQLLKNERKK